MASYSKLDLGGNLYIGHTISHMAVRKFHKI